MQFVPEQSRAGWRFLYEDEDLKPFAPATAQHRVHDKDTGQELLSWTADAVETIAGPGSTLKASFSDIVIPASVNRILNDSNAYETRVITVQSDFGTDDQLTAEREYRVKNLSGFT